MRQIIDRAVVPEGMSDIFAATYRDASDQCSLSCVWGGIHPPADDIAGRLIGIAVGIDAFALAQRHFAGEINCQSSVASRTAC